MLKTPACLKNPIACGTRAYALAGGGGGLFVVACNHVRADCPLSVPKLPVGNMPGAAVASIGFRRFARHSVD